MSIQQNFKHAKARKRIAYGGAAILLAITGISMVSSFKIYQPSFQDLGGWMQNGLALFCVGAVEGCFCWLLLGFKTAFSSFIERCGAIVGIAGLLGVMGMNIATHGMMSKGYPLAPFQTAWLEWAAYIVLIGILILVLVITLGDPAARLIRLELKTWGMQKETIIQAQQAALESERIQTAMLNRANSDAETLARQIEGQAGYVTADDDDDYLPQSGQGLNGRPIYAHKSDDRGKA